VLFGLGVSACFRDRTADDPGEATDAERIAFQAPADSSLTPGQVDQYLRTIVAQLELLQTEAPAMREQLAAVPRERRQPAPPTSAQTASPPKSRPKSRQALWGDFVDATFVRSARKLGYNPAELWYVRDRMSVVSGHLLATEMHASKDQAAALFRQQAEAMRGTPGVTQAQIDAMLKAAQQAEQQTARPVPPRVEQNLGALRRARGTLSDTTWGKIASVATGAGLGDLGEAPEAELDRRLNELRTLHLQALEGDDPPR
jgi:hypothetical protein